MIDNNYIDNEFGTEHASLLFNNYEEFQKNAPSVQRRTKGHSDKNRNTQRRIHTSALKKSYPSR